MSYWLNPIIPACSAWQGDGGDENRKEFIAKAAMEVHEHIRLIEAALFLARYLGWTRKETRDLRDALHERQEYGKFLWMIRDAFVKPGTIFCRDLWS